MTRSFILATLLATGAVLSPHLALAQATDQATTTPAPVATDTSGATTDQTMGSATTTTTSTGGGYWGLLGLIGLLGLMGMRNRTIT